MSIDYLMTTDIRILEELGSRIKKLRLRKNMRRIDVADHSGLSIDTVKRLESGQGRLISLIAVLRTLNALDQLDAFIPPVEASPIEALKLRGKQRQRASGD